MIHLFASQADERTGRWVRFEHVAAGDGLALTQWFDLAAFFADRAFFELMSYRVVPIHRNRWRRRPSTSSGVGRQLTLRLRGRANVYQTYPPLVFHGDEPSVMNPQARAREPHDNRALRYAPIRTRADPQRVLKSPARNRRPRSDAGQLNVHALSVHAV